MAIKVEKANTKPALVYDNLFLEQLSLTQKQEKDDSKPPMYCLNIRYRMFAVDNEGIRHFAERVDEIMIDDYYGLAIAKAATGDYDLAQAAGAIEVALARIIEDQTNLGKAEVV